jgi:hypothetical protein
MKASQSNIRFAFILAAGLLVNNSFAQQGNSGDSTNQLPVIPYSMTVVFVDFTISTSVQGNQINWSTILESNLAKYEIQRSTSNKPFETIGSLVAKGSNSISVNYSFTDSKPSAGNNIYRLKLIDTHNGIKYSENKIVNSGIQAMEIHGFNAYPNPAKAGSTLTLDISQSGQYDIAIHNINGKMMYAGNLFSSHVSSLSFKMPSNLTPGFYVVTITQSENQKRYQQKIMIL